MLGPIRLVYVFAVETILVGLVGGGVNDSGMDILVNDSGYVLRDHHVCIHLCGY